MRPRVSVGFLVSADMQRGVTGYCAETQTGACAKLPPAPLRTRNVRAPPPPPPHVAVLARTRHSHVTTFSQDCLIAHRRPPRVGLCLYGRTPSTTTPSKPSCHTRRSRRTTLGVWTRVCSRALFWPLFLPQILKTTFVRREPILLCFALPLASTTAPARARGPSPSCSRIPRNRRMNRRRVRISPDWRQL